MSIRPWGVPSALQDLTQYNTAHNRQISTVGIREDERTRKRKARPRSVSFYDEEEVINPGKEREREGGREGLKKESEGTGESMICCVPPG